MTIAHFILGIFRNDNVPANRASLGDFLYDKERSEDYHVAMRSGCTQASAVLSPWGVIAKIGYFRGWHDREVYLTAPERAVCHHHLFSWYLEDEADVFTSR